MALVGGGDIYAAWFVYNKERLRVDSNKTKLEAFLRIFS